MLHTMLQVSGPPRLYGPLSHSVHVGHSAVLELSLCSDPAPLTNTWQWESVVLPAGASLDTRSVVTSCVHRRANIS